LGTGTLCSEDCSKANPKSEFETVGCDGFTMTGPLKGDFATVGGKGPLFRGSPKGDLPEVGCIVFPTRGPPKGEVGVMVIPG
jgi:hypothetical protein